MAEKTTRVVVEAQPKGVEAADRQIRKMGVGLKTVADRQRDFVALDKTLGRVTKQFAGLASQMDRMGRAFRMTGPTAQLREMQRAVEGVTRATNALTAASARYAQGPTAPGAAPGAPGAPPGPPPHGGGGGGTPTHRIAAGTFLGHAAYGLWNRASHGVREGFTTPFTGQQGFLGALSSVPVLGPLGAGMVGTGMGAAQQYLAGQQRQYSMAYLTGGNYWGQNKAVEAYAKEQGATVPIPEFNPAQVEAAREREYQRSMSRVEGSYFDQAVQARAIKDRVEAGEFTWENAPDLRGPPAPGEQRDVDYQTMLAESKAREALEPNVERLAREGADAAGAAEEKRQRDDIAAAQTKRDEVTARALAEARDSPYDMVKQIGELFGKAGPEALGLAGEFYKSSGRTMADLRTERGVTDLQAAMGAQARYGLGAAEAGLLVRGGGAGQLGGKDLDATIRQAAGAARGRGLRGEDVTRAISEIADRVRGWEQTGIPVASESLESLQQGFSGALGGIRGSVVGAQFLAAQQQKSIAGPSSDEDVYALSSLYGYKPGSGAEGLLEALKRQERGEVTGDLKAFSGVGQGAYGELMGFSRARSQGINITREELAKGMPGFGRLGKVAGPDAGPLASQSFAPEDVQREARTANLRERAGAGFVGTAQALEEAMLSNVEKLGEIGPDLKRLAEWMGSGGGPVIEAIKTLDHFVKVVVEKLEKL